MYLLGKSVKFCISVANLNRIRTGYAPLLKNIRSISLVINVKVQ